jgi:outer membrane usher protein
LLVSAQDSAATETLLSVRVNGKQISEAEPVLRDGPSRWFVTASVFRSARLRLPKALPVRVSGLEYYPLDAISGIQIRLDDGAQMLDIIAPASAFLNTALVGVDRKSVVATRPEPGLFLNHDFQMTSGTGRQQLSGIVEGGLFSGLGVFTTQYAGRDLTNRVAPLRLSTQFFRDFPEHMSTLTIGDTISEGSPWGKRIYYGGIRWASKFSTQPNFIPTALPSLSGQVAQPSTLDIYVDNVRRLSQPVDPGPFAIRDIPVISGQGEIRMVVTDVMGRQQVISESYIRSNQLLRKSVTEFAYEAGSPRLQYGVKSNAYSSVFGAATYRRGITNKLTIEGRGEVQPDSETAGIGAVYGLRGLGLVSAGVAGSLSSGHSGDLVYAEFSQSRRSFGFGGRVQRATEDFRQVGLGKQERATKMLMQGEVSKALGNHGTVAVGYLRRDGRTELDVRALTASVSLRVRRAVLTVGGTYSVLNKREYGLNVALVLPRGERKMAVASSDVSGVSKTASVEVSQQLPLGPGYGYRVKTTTLDQNRTEAAFSYQNTEGTYVLEAAQSSGETDVRFSERGAFVLLHRHVLMSPWLNDSFGVIEVANEKNVPVYVNNQILAKTGSRGLALVPWLIPYNENSIHLDDSGLPIDVNLDLADRTIVPMPRSGVFLRYKPTSIGGATVILVTASGEYVPQGATVTLNGKQGQYQVALRGEVFIPDIEYPAVVRVMDLAGQKCAVRIERPPENTPVPKIGPLMCRAEK